MMKYILPFLGLFLVQPVWANSANWFEVTSGGDQPTTVAACNALAVASPTARVGSTGLRPGETLGWCATNGANDDESGLIEVIRTATVIITPDALAVSGAGRIYIIKCQYPTVNDFWCKKQLFDTNADGVINATDDTPLTGEPGVNASQSKFVYNLERGWYFFDFCENENGHGYCEGEDGTGGDDDGIIPADGELYLVTLEGNE